MTPPAAAAYFDAVSTRDWNLSSPEAAWLNPPAASRASELILTFKIATLAIVLHLFGFGLEHVAHRGDHAGGHFQDGARVQVERASEDYGEIFGVAVVVGSAASSSISRLAASRQNSSNVGDSPVWRL